MKPRTLRTATLATVLTLGACSGSPKLTEDETDRLQPDPRVVRLEGLLDRSDTLLVSGLHSRYSLSAQGETASNSSVEARSCAGARCAADDGTVITVRDLIDPSVDIGPDAIANLGMRDGFASVTVKGRFEVAETVPDIALAASPAVYSHGFWGKHGFATGAVGAGPLTGQVEGTSFNGDIAIATAYAAGDAADTDPGGIGSATWTGIVETASTRTFERHQGTVTVTVTDLSRPRVNIVIDVPGHDIGALVWDDMPLTNGRFTAGTAGGGYLSGDFHGPDHSEVWGVFDTRGYVGAFGAKRVQTP